MSNFICMQKGPIFQSALFDTQNSRTTRENNLHHFPAGRLFFKVFAGFLINPLGRELNLAAVIGAKTLNPH